MRHAFRLGEFEPVPPRADQEGQPEAAPDVHVENRRLMREAKLRMARLAAKNEAVKDQAEDDARARMDLPELSVSECEGEGQKARAQEDRAWPRPRALALIVVITLAAVVPSLTMRLLVWMVVLLLMTAVMLGPERARDGLYAMALHLSRLWGREIGFMRRLLDRMAP
ncbi:MAG: hypothetical protein GJ677_01530 [Rhodobacteraceae bacterium]|nr:hypothetical protein [Paracoccaceae bacterium]